MKKMDKRLFLRGKLTEPVASPLVITRARLIRFLDKAGESRCHSLVAPAGFGKTTLMVDWIDRKRCNPVWLTVEPDDNNPFRFWTGLALAFSQQGYPTPTCKDLMACMSDEVGSREWINQFINELADATARQGVPAALILDDLHHLENPELIAALARVIRFLPTSVNLYLLSRSRLPKAILAFMTGDGVVQLDASDLAFSLEEGKQYLRALQANGVHGEDNPVIPVHINSRLVRIWRKSEGWPVFFCAMANRVFRNTANSMPVDPGLGDYIEENIQQDLAPEVRALLVDLAPIGSFNKNLVAQCLYPQDSSECVEKVIAASGLVVHVPEAPGFYRLRQPLRDYLKEGRERWGADAGLIHFRKVFRWYLANNAVHEAITLCVEARYWQSAVHLIERQYGHLVESGRWPEMAHWIDVIPEPIARKRPLVLMLKARQSLFECSPRAAIVNLDHADQLLSALDQPIDHPDNLYSDMARPALREEIEALRVSTQGLYSRNHPYQSEVLFKDRAALESLSPVLDYQQGLRALYGNRLGEAKRILTRVLERALTNHRGLLIQTITLLGWVHYLTGEFDHWIAMAVSLKERHSRDERTQAYGAWVDGATLLINLERSAPDHRIHGLAHNVEGNWNLPLDIAPVDIGFSLLLMRAAVSMQQGRLEDTDAMLAEARVLANELPAIVQENTFAIPALQAELLSRQGKVGEALHLLEARPTNSGDAGLAGQHACLVRGELLLAQDQGQVSLECFAGVEAWAEASGCSLLLMRSLIGKSMALQNMRQVDRATEVFHTALRLGRSMGSVRPFLKDAREMKRLLAQARRVARYPHYVGRLIAARGDDVTGQDDGGADLSVLSKREKQVLDLLVTGMSNPEIADTLCRSLGTVKIHVHNIYQKLGASNRVMAINKYLTASASNVA